LGVNCKVDKKDLTRRLVKIVGDDAVLADEQELVVYECDAYTLQKNLPTAVVLPKSAREVAAIVRLCAELDLPIIPRGAGTSLSGAVLAVDGGVMIALTRMNRVLNIDPRNRRALVEAGCVNAWITRDAKKHGLFYAPDPSSQPACTIGGNIATNSGGPHTLKNGVTPTTCSATRWCCPTARLSGSVSSRTAVRRWPATTCVAPASARKACSAS